jgi:hypothetical protein
MGASCEDKRDYNRNGTDTRKNGTREGKRYEKLRARFASRGHDKDQPTSRGKVIIIQFCYVCMVW